MSPAAWAWAGLAVLVAAFVTGVDLSFPAHTMSAQFHQWMQDQVIGPIITGAWVGISAGFLYHFLINK